MDFEFEDVLDAENHCFSVSEATQKIKYLLENSLLPMQIEGEISNFTHHSSGHMYFSIKDKNAQMPCVMWGSRNQYLRFMPESGMLVRVHGRVTVYERRGQYQFDIAKMEPAGAGPLQQAFEMLKAKLFEEGLFDENRKKSIPVYPQKIGVVTSPTGAAIRDLVSVIQRRWPVAEIIIRPALVQGEGAAPDIVRAINEFHEYNDIDVLIVGRGGGSLEDLWAFNEETVARAIAASEVPVISAVGHEIDFTIADFVADLRAPTPSVAGEMVVPNKKEFIDALHHLALRSYRFVNNQIQNGTRQLESLTKSYGFRQPIEKLRQAQQTIDDLEKRLQAGGDRRIEDARKRLDNLHNLLKNLSHEQVLKRGFSITRDAKTGDLVRRAQEMHKDQKIKIVFYDGEGKAKVEQVNPNKNV